MKTLALACGLVALSSAADAATYRFSFRSEVFQPTPQCYQDGSVDCARQDRLEISLVFRLPDLVSREIWLHGFHEAGGFGPGPYVLQSNYTVLSSVNNFESPPYIGEDGYLRTDASGALTSAYWFGSSDTPDVSAFLTSASWGSCCETWFRAPGAWTVSPVPLPASGVLLLTSVAAIALAQLRRLVAQQRRARQGHPFV